MNILICGASGAMGKILAEVLNENGHNVVAGIDKVSYDARFPIYSSICDVKEKIDCIIDFSNPALLADILSYAKANTVPAVIATTGISDDQIEKIKETAAFTPVFFSYNMSFGVNLLSALAKKATDVLGKDFDIEIIEKHHNRKLDAPSGTAIMLANAISDSLDSKPDYVYDRHSKREKRSKNEIGISSIRGGTIVGEHEILFAGKDEVVSLKHTAFSRSIFANGAVKAAEFISDKKNGLYSMDDLL